ncbi:NAD(P)H-dependent oxidoreductase [Pontibacter sp. G13]|uniref:NADPH-dependent FMN reductase n=1 Tax=Pontibacter sp. G13 TaxID=3074898 RepID=UPI00288926F7|nr:NAD(P)H-dependent oxidoreductase [Pontibacter sp. G13]WNJ17666.1 NAD(P)H-dependent oxidoreductase [Pontibacter sp. G13]
MNRVLAFSGSNSSNSINQALVKYSATLVDAEIVEVIDLREFDTPIFGVDLEQEIGSPESIQKLYAKFVEADGFLISLPEHNSMMPTFFKNLLDWLSRVDRKFFQGKPIVLLSTSPGPNGGKWALQHFAGLLPRFGGVLKAQLSLGKFGEIFDRELEKVVDESALKLLKTTVEALSKENEAVSPEIG